MESSQLTKPNHPAKLVVFADGTGTLFSAIATACQDHTLPAIITSVISHHAKAPVLEKAKKYGIPTQIFDPKNYPSMQKWDAALCFYLKNQAPDWIILAGFLKKLELQVLTNFPRRIINIHPSLLPRYGGQGMYGIHVHQAVLDHGDQKTGISIHFVSKDYDTGPIIAQKEVPVSPEDTAESLQKKIKQIEQVFYVSTLKKIIQNNNIQ